MHSYPVAHGILLTLMLVGCRTRGLQGDEDLHADFRFPVVRDTLFDELSYKEEEWLCIAGYSPLYLGPLADTVSADHGLKFSGGRKHPLTGKGEHIAAQVCFVDRPSARTFKEPDSSTIIVIVDTSHLIATTNPGSRHAYKAYPVLLVSNDKDTVIVGSGSYLRMFMEARTESGSWMPIEEKFEFGCGVGVGSIVLPPDYVALSSAPIYRGDFQTECRLKFGETYSNTFHAGINRRQFESKFDESGNLKEE